MENYVGKRLDGRYEIQEIIGVGGMAVVYKAYDNIDDRIVAVKVLKEEFLANADFRRRFKNESKAISVLSHPNIVKVYDVSFGDRLQYIVMEYVEGITLKEYIEQKGAISWHDCLKFLIQILRALQHAHDKGIVHRDVKPQNIMLLQQGTIKITDFGIARFSRSETRTMTENAIGSVHYISPEQAKGDLTDEKADIYSVGVVMYEMLTGQLPFESDNPVTVALMQVQKDAKNPREIKPDIPLGLEQITMRAMQKNSADRYQSAAEMLLDLDEFKRNPSIKFDYSYYVDRQPTRYSDRVIDKLPVPPEENVEIIEDTEETRRRSTGGKALPIVLGIGMGLVMVVIIVVLMLARTGFGKSGSKLEVENFIGKNYYEEIQPKLETDYAKYVFKLEFEANSQKSEGEIVRQNPSGGTKIDFSDEVTLTVISNSTVEVPDVYGDMYSQAQTKLKNLGFIVTIEQVQDATKTVGTVISTEPEKGAQAPRGSTVKLLVAVKSRENLALVPNVVTWSVNDAKAMFEKEGLIADIVYINSTEDRDIVVMQSEEKGTLVEKGSSITIHVSNGVPPTSAPPVSSTTEPPWLTDPSLTDPSATDPSATDPSATDPSATDPSSTDPSATDPSATDPSATDPSATQPTTQPVAQPQA